MKKWIYSLICLGYLTHSLATEHSSFLVTGEDVKEMNYFDRLLETPNFFSRVYPQNMNPNLLLIPRANSGFEYGVWGFYQRPYDNQLDFAIPDPSTAPFYLVSPGSSIRTVDPDYEFGYGAYLGYVFPYMGRDIRLDVFTFSGTANDSSHAAGDGIVWTPLVPYDLTTIAKSAISRLDTDVEQAKLMVGQEVYGGTRFRLHPALGAKYASINRELDTHYPVASAPPLLPDVAMDSFVEQKSRFKGIGPAIQVDGAYFFTPGFGLAGHITSALLVGSVSSELRYTDDRSPAGSTQINLPTTDRTVPNLDGQLGLVFRHLFCGTHTTLEVELGYDFNHFFNAIDTYRSTGVSVLAPQTSIPYTATHLKHVHDLTLDGPYLSIGISGIACPSDVVIDPILFGVPRLDGGFIFGLGAGYLRVDHNQLDYALLDPTAISFLGNSDFPVPTLNATLQDIDPDNAYGGMITLGYIFRNSPYDIQAHYQHASANDSSKITAPSTGVIWPILSTPVFDMSLVRSYATEANASASFNYHDFNLEFGQTICADTLIWLRLFGGIEYASINSNFHTTYNNLHFPNTFDPNLVIPEENIVQSSDFSGIGPRLGFNLTLPVGGFALTSEVAGGILVGGIDSSYKDQFPQLTLPDTSPFGAITVGGGELGVRTDSETQSSPFVNLKVGLAYTFDFFNRTKWTLDFGYMAVHYFNAATTFRHATNSAAVFVKQVHDVSIEGPYLNLTVFGFGACPPDCIVREPYAAFAPVLRGGFEFGVEGFYLQPHVMNTDYGIKDPAPAVVPILNSNVLNINPGSHSHMHVLTPQHEFGYRAHLGYIFPLTANDVSINYADLSGTTSQSTTAEPNGVIWTITNGNYSGQSGAGLLPITPFLPFPVFANRADASADFTWQTGNLEFGRRMKLHQLMTRFFAGLAYARVIEDMDITYTDGFTLTSPATGESVAIASDSIGQNNSFYGFGPRLGVGADLALGCGFSFVGQVGTDLLVGKINTQLTESSSAGVSTSLNPDHRTRLVPAVDAKLGFAFTVPFSTCSQFGIEAGYQFNHYFNVKDSMRFTDNFSTFVKQDQDISFDGPYVRFQVDI